MKQSVVHTNKIIAKQNFQAQSSMHFNWKNSYNVELKLNYVTMLTSNSLPINPKW